MKISEGLKNRLSDSMFVTRAISEMVAGSIDDAEEDSECRDSMMFSLPEANMRCVDGLLLAFLESDIGDADQDLIYLRGVIAGWRRDNAVV